MRIYERLIAASGDFDPNAPVDPDVEQFLRANIAAYEDCLPQWVAHVIGVASEPERLSTLNSSAVGTEKSRR